VNDTYGIHLPEILRLPAFESLTAFAEAEQSQQPEVIRHQSLTKIPVHLLTLAKQKFSDCNLPLRLLLAAQWKLHHLEIPSECLAERQAGRLTTLHEDDTFMVLGENNRKPEIEERRGLIFKGRSLLN
jgi:hypothetical protein